MSSRRWCCAIEVAPCLRAAPRDIRATSPLHHPRPTHRPACCCGAFQIGNGQLTPRVDVTLRSICYKVLTWLKESPRD